MEGGPKHAEAKGNGYEKEAVLEAARTELQDRLLDVEIPAETPEEFAEVIRLETFAASLEDPQAERHLIKAANVELNETLDALPFGTVKALERYKLERQIFGPANDDRAPEAQAA